MKLYHNLAKFVRTELRYLHFVLLNDITLRNMYAVNLNLIYLILLCCKGNTRKRGAKRRKM